MLCPHACGVDRTRNELGVCACNHTMKIAYAGVVEVEESALRGENGSGTVFFTGCTLSCAGCSSWQISHAKPALGGEVSVDELIAIFMALEAKGAHNINLITGTQYIPDIEEAVGNARRKGLSLPIVWNTSGFETLAQVKRLKQWVDIFATDVKTIDNKNSQKLFGTDNYTDVVMPAVMEMAKGLDLVYKSGFTGDPYERPLEKGVIVRHLLYPGEAASSRKVCEWFARNYNGRALFEVLLRYFPTETMEPLQEQLRVLTNNSDVDSLESVLSALSIKNVIINEYELEYDWRPDFTKDSPFDAEENAGVYHFAQKLEDRSILEGKEQKPVLGAPPY